MIKKPFNSLIRWMNGLHLRSLSQDELVQVFEDRWKSVGILVDSDGTFAKVYLILQLIRAAMFIER